MLLHASKGAILKRSRIFSICLSFSVVFVSLSYAQKPLSNAHPLGSHLSENYKEDLDGLLKRRYIRVLTTLNQTNFFLHHGRFFGYEYEIVKGYEKELNKGKKSKELRTVVEFIPTNRDELIPKLIAGYGDIAAAGLTITDSRRRKIDFTIPYLTGVDEVIVTHKQAFQPKTVENLSGRRIFVRKSSSYYESITAINKRLRKSGKRPLKIIAADENLETEDILELVNTGAVKFTVSDSHIANIWSKIFPNLLIRNDLKLRTGGEIAWMIRKKSPKLKASLNRYLKNRQKGTLLGNIYFKRYYEENQWIKSPLLLDRDKKLLKYKDLLKKYADRYGFDWLLIAALAYQESTLDHSKKNKSGAVGLMQVLPSTAKDKNVGIHKVHKLENNVHAGVKYLAFLKKKYFSDPKIRPRDQVRLALAAYNAGPAKIQRARTKTKKMGLNPNRWFRNVELATLKIVGQETVRYVSNINKYYVIYRFTANASNTSQKEIKQIGKNAS
jgi:membrane-bound lytic murein transglycosylase MltF